MGRSVKVFGRKFFSFGCRKYSSRNPLDFRSNRVSKKFMNDLAVEGERKRHIFTTIIFCLRVPKSFKKEPSVLWFRKLQGSKKFLKKRGEGGSIKTFRRRFFVSQYRKVSRRNPSVLCFRKFPIEKNFIDKRRGLGWKEYQGFSSRKICVLLPKVL